MDAQPGIWDDLTFPENDFAVWQAGSLTCWYRRQGRQIFLAHSHDADAFQSPVLDESANHTTVERWSLDREVSGLSVSPVFPERAFVIKPEMTFRVMKGVQTRIFIRVPIWTRLETGKQLLLELPLLILSTTWSGTFMEGELCYSIRSGIRSSVTPDPERPHMAICPLHISNRSDADLMIEKINLHVANLSLFIHEGQLWSDETRIEYKGENDVSQIKVSGKPPAEAEGAQLVAKPRNPSKKRLSARTFTSLKDLPGFGLTMR